MGYCYICDRCGKIVSSTVYTVGIGAESVMGGSNVESTVFNLSYNLSPDKKVCRDCVNVILEVMRPLKRRAKMVKTDNPLSLILVRPRKV